MEVNTEGFVSPAFVQKHGWKPDSVVNTIYFSAEAVTPAHGPADNQELDKMFRLKNSNVTRDKPHDCSYEVTREHVRGEPHHTGTHAVTQRAVNVRRSSSRDADGSFTSVEANPQPVQLWGLKRHFRRLDDKSQNSAAMFHAFVLVKCFVSPDLGNAVFVLITYRCPVSHTFHALVPPGVILLGKDSQLQPSVTDFVPMRQTTAWKRPAAAWK